jgi:hypothetical protein
MTGTMLKPAISSANDGDPISGAWSNYVSYCQNG